MSRGGVRIKRNKPKLAVVLALFCIAALLWGWGLIAFIGQIPTRVTDRDSLTDAIVVLTGGSLRLDTGLRLLRQKQGEKLFVSGVYRGVDVQRLLTLSEHNRTELLCCINLGYQATSTAANARETRAWLTEQGYHSLRLVTASYHMPRSLLEFHQYHARRADHSPCRLSAPVQIGPMVGLARHGGLDF